MHIIQISDLHIPANPLDTVKGVNTLAVFKKLIPIIDKKSPDLLVITGDLAGTTPESDCYFHIKQVLDQLSIPWIALKGNHDRSESFDDILVDHLPPKNTFLLSQDNAKLLFFDTSVETLPKELLQELENDLVHSQYPNYLFTHYPPVCVNHPIFDEDYPLFWRKEFFNVLSKSRTPLFIFFGHIHFEFQIKYGHLHLFSAPSATIPILPNTSDFIVDHNSSYFREINISSNYFDTKVYSIS